MTLPEPENALNLQNDVYIHNESVASCTIRVSVLPQ